MNGLTRTFLSFLVASSLLVSAVRAEPPEASAKSSNDRSRPNVEALMGSFGSEPSVRAVQRAALRHAGLDAKVPRNWGRRARLANLVPDIQGEIDWLDGTDRELEYSEDFEFGDSTGDMTRDTADHQFVEDRTFRTGYAVEAEFELGGLIFDRDEIYAARELREQQVARRKLVATVTDLYFRRRKRQVLRLVTPPRRWKRRLELVVAIERLTARIDGLTGGWYRRRVETTTPGTTRRGR